MSVIPLDFYRGDDPVLIARKLLGAHLITNIHGVRTSGRIIETEAYRGWGDDACHAHAGTRSPRTEVMYGNGGAAYVLRMIKRFRSWILAQFFLSCAKSSTASSPIFLR